MRRTFNDLARRAGVDAVVTRSITGHVTEQMREHYSSVDLDEKRAAIANVVRLVPRAQPLECDAAALERVTAAAFGQRRKMLRQSLRSLGIDPMPLLEAAGLSPTSRAEEAPVSAFVAMANRLGAIGRGENA